MVERRMQRGQLIGGAQAPVPVFVPHADADQVVELYTKAVQTA